MLDGNTGQERTFGDYHARSGGFAATLRDMGIKEGGTVAMLCPNHVDYAPVTLATSLNGAKITPINPLYTVDEINMVIRRSGASVLVVHQNILEAGLQSAKDCSDTIKNVVVITDAPGTAVPEGTTSFDAVCDHSSPFFKTIMEQHESTDQFPVILPYSSGTTGLPKGVCLTHNNIASNIAQISLADGDEVTPDSKNIGPLPFFHIYALTVTMLFHAWKGITVCTSSGRFDLEFFCQMVQEHRPVRAHLVPPIILGLAKHPIVDKYDMSSLKMIVSGAAPLGKEVVDEAKKRLSVGIKQAWGMSETSPVGCYPKDSMENSGSIGPPVASSFLKVIDSEGNSLGPDEDGELCLKGPQVMMGYLVS